MKKLLFSLMFVFTALQLFAQNPDVEMADVMRSNGKIYVLVACVLVILLGFIFYLFSVDKRLKKIEKEIEN